MCCVFTGLTPWCGLALHWGRDMEMSCDEQVIKELGPELKKDYSKSLLSLATDRMVLGVSPLSFGESAVKGRIKNILNYRKPTLWVIIVGIVLVVALGVGLLSNPSAAVLEDDNEKIRMAEIWATALKTRDGKPRYEMMSENMKEKFITEQKLRAGEDWNFNIGYSSPRVVDFEIQMNGDTASIIYHQEDSGGDKYDRTEILTFGIENNRLVITDARQKIEEWDRWSYFATDAKMALDVYTEALLNSDYLTILSLTHDAAFDPEGQEVWDTVNINDVKVIKADVRENKACYWLELNIKDGGYSAFETGVSPRWLWLVKGEHGWYAEGLMTGGPPMEDWWYSKDPMK